MSKIEDEFSYLGRTEKVKFISENVGYANAVSIAKYVKSYLFDVLKDVKDDDYVAMYLKNKGYEVIKRAYGKV